MNTPDPKLKGAEGGNCNRTACQQPGAVWYNESTHFYYCRNCAITIQREENDREYIRGIKLPMVIFKGIFDCNDPRHQVKYDNG